MFLHNFFLKKLISFPPDCLSSWYAQSVSLPVFFIAFWGTYCFFATPTYVLALQRYLPIFCRDFMETVSVGSFCVNSSVSFKTKRAVQNSIVLREAEQVENKEETNGRVK